MSGTLWTPGEAQHAYAMQAPDEVVIVFARRDGQVESLTRAEFDCRSSRLAHRLIEDGVGPGEYVAIILPNGLEHLVATLAVYKAGGTPMPVSHGMPARERDALLVLARPRCIVCDDPSIDGLSSSEILEPGPYPDTPPPPRTPEPVKVLCSGGSTGRPKLIVSPGAFRYAPGGHPLAALLRFESTDLKYSPGPLYHNGPFFFTQIMLFQGGRVMLNERFNAAQALDLIEQYRPTILNVVPTMMQRMLREPGVERRDLTSLRYLWHVAAPCPAWVKRGFIELLGAERVLEMWAATEVTGATVIDGAEWLERPGSVGRGVMTEFRIVDEERRPVPAGEIGEIFSRFSGREPAYQYLGSEPLESLGDGFVSVGDLGYLDDDGYLYLSDRRSDMIISGGANIFPAEVEAVISEHPAVRDVAVVGLADGDLGRRVHAIVETRDSADPPTVAELEALCSGALARYKVPRSFELVERLPRNEAGKIRRAALRDERDALSGR